MKTTGIFFEVHGDGARIRLSRRIDLVRSRMGQQGQRVAALARARRNAEKAGRAFERSFTPTVVGAVETPSVEFGRKLRRVLERVFAAKGSGGIIPAASVGEALRRCQALGLNSADIDTPVRTPKFQSKTETRLRYVPDPMMTRAELLHRLERKPGGRRTGQIKADVDMRNLVGGLAKLSLSEAQIQGASHFRRSIEHSQIGGSRAIDYAAVKVDSSGINATAVIETTERARADCQLARQVLGSSRYNLAERIIVQEQTAAEVARLTIGAGGTARDKITRMVLDIADELAEIFGYAKSRAWGARLISWSDGTEAVVVRTDADEAA